MEFLIKPKDKFVIITQVIITKVFIMKFYNREKELEVLKRANSLKSQKSIMTMLIGRRRVGKTTLTLQNYSNEKVLYFFVSKKNEQLLCEEFCNEIVDKLEVKIFGKLTKFEDLFEYILELGKTQSFTLIIDEFQEFIRVNKSVFSEMQRIWDLNKQDSKINLLVCGSVNSLMNKLFKDSHEPLYGRQTLTLKVEPFPPSVLKDTVTTS